MPARRLPALLRLLPRYPFMKCISTRCWRNYAPNENRSRKRSSSGSGRPVRIDPRAADGNSDRKQCREHRQRVVTAFCSTWATTHGSWAWQTSCTLRSFTIPHFDDSLAERCFLRNSRRW